MMMGDMKTMEIEPLHFLPFYFCLLPSLATSNTAWAETLEVVTDE
jgi:hypothetical protein